MNTESQRLAQALRDTAAGHLVIVTGAGISLASGIATFRGDDADAVWKNDVLEKGTAAFFRRDPVASWSWSRQLFGDVPAARPNPAHRALAAIEGWHRSRGGRVTLITQNVDSLHEKAGSRDVVKVHGTLDRLRCVSDQGCRLAAPKGTLATADVDFVPFDADPCPETLPRCPECGDLLRPHVLWFNELYTDHEQYQWPRVQAAAVDADLLLFIGTSFALILTDLFLHAAFLNQVPAFSIDPAASANPGLECLQARAEELLPALCQELAIPYV